MSNPFGALAISDDEGDDAPARVTSKKETKASSGPARAKGPSGTYASIHSLALTKFFFTKRWIPSQCSVEPSRLRIV